MSAWLSWILMVGSVLFIVGCLFQNPWIGVPGYLIGLSASLVAARRYLDRFARWMLEQAQR